MNQLHLESVCVVLIASCVPAWAQDSLKSVDAEPPLPVSLQFSVYIPTLQNRQVLLYGDNRNVGVGQRYFIEPYLFPDGLPSAKKSLVSAGMSLQTQ